MYKKFKNKKILLLSIKPKYAKKILAGNKTVELRKNKPKIDRGDIVLIYESSPTMAMVGYGIAECIIEGAPNKLWELVGDNAGIIKAEFNEYYAGCTYGCAISFTKVKRLKKTIDLESIKEKWRNFHPPQIYQYVTYESLKCLAF